MPETKQHISEFLPTMSEKRAATPEAKREVVDRIFTAWIKAPQLRLGQLLTAAISPTQAVFYVEDWPLVEAVERMVEK